MSAPPPTEIMLFLSIYKLFHLYVSIHMYMLDGCNVKCMSCGLWVKSLKIIAIGHLCLFFNPEISLEFKTCGY